VAEEPVAEETTEDTAVAEKEALKEEE